MQIQPEIAFHNVSRPDWAEDAILDHVARLEDIYHRLITCRVRVDQRANNSSNTVPPVVRIEMSVPGYKDIVVAHEPDHLQRKFQAPDLHTPSTRHSASRSGGWRNTRISCGTIPPWPRTRTRTNISARSWS